MTTPEPVPAALADQPFSTAEAQAVGLSRKRLRAKDLHKPTYAARSLSPCEDFRGRVRAFAAVLPEDVLFSHLTAARLHNLPLPRTWSPPEPLDVMRARGRPPITRAGCLAHTGAELRMPVTVGGLTATSTLDTWVDLGSQLDLDDLVAAGDPMLSDRLSRDDVVGFVEESSGIPGVARAREAALLIRPGSASAWESKARVAFVHAGLPEPELKSTSSTPTTGG